jgi:tyrosyl-tRNA synthetase
MFGKIMSISDELMWRYYELATDLTTTEIEKMKSSNENPRNFKVNLAKSIIKDFHSQQAATEAEENFVRQFVNKDVPDEIEEISLNSATYKVIDILIKTNLVESKGEAKRLIQQGGVKIDGNKVGDASLEIEISSDKTFIFQVGKRKFLKVIGN